MTDKLFEKIGSYDLVNNIIPGCILYEFSFFLFNNISIVDNILGKTICYYFLGIIINRIGSFFIEPILKRTKLITYSPYVEYLNAKNKDSDIGILLEKNNMYRTFISLFFTTTIVYTIYLNIDKISIHMSIFIYSLFTLLIILFIFSFIKQTNFIKQRIEKANKA